MSGHFSGRQRGVWIIGRHLHGVLYTLAHLMLSAILITGVSAFGANLHYYIVGQIVGTFKSVHITEVSAMWGSTVNKYALNLK